ncbi:methyltransferase family protein [Spirosoma utsteinense]|uniref:Protein-S-isoprenylcysteine O-methyltransferase Ste14 n=1 Tax=Spirosoma utsteinense TaxID=2585773 RepID=A0ABR6WA06_9BACT|nr:isoprenylcysteine carboxylmethyltransferase family protein [Spirosoma utsteinense]MBC3787024.1 protein-S-isoprenylcysteine O-methyltransferase Ste14 [Spirosoma utsteinense]MBC3793394.1 protein-S-isoprenylcysteine O-methyltransferase Ste14 [Spirosoma utsteinense]
MSAYVPLFLAWLLFGALHSLTAATAFKQWAVKAGARFFRYYRLVYNAVALVTFLPVLLAYGAAPRQTILVWTGSEMIGLGLIVLGVVLGVTALRGYDLAEFAGWPPRQTAAKPETLRRQGLLRYVRHPLYVALLIVLAGLLVRQPTLTNLLFDGFAFLYIRIGIYFEEQKLLTVFGHQYRQYQKQVPMLLPFSKLE